MMGKRILKTVIGLGLVGVIAACEPTITAPSKPKGPPIEVVEAGRKLDTVRVAMRYKDGSAIPEADAARAMTRATEVACLEGETPIPDTTSSANGILTANVFCTQVLTTDQVVDGSAFVNS